MDWKHDIYKENRGRSTRLGICEEPKDFSSDLPDEILLHILSFLPTRDAIKIALIQRCGNRWRGVPVLHFDQCMDHNCCNGPYYNMKFLNLIRQVLKLNESQTLDKLGLRFSFHKDYIVSEGSEVSRCEDYFSQLKSIESEINLLAHYALTKKVKILDLDLLGCGLDELIEDYILPDSVLRNDYLTELRLAYCNIKSQGEIGLKSLKVLSLTEIELSDKIMQKILIGSPKLEVLSLIGCSRKLECSSKNLKKLSLVLRLGREFIISCPYVISMEISGSIDRAVLLDVPSVIETSLFLSSNLRIVPSRYDDVKRLVLKFSQCQTFKLCTFCTLVWSVLELSNEPCPYFNWKKLILHLSFTKWQHPGILLLLRRSQCLETLTIHISPVSDSMSMHEAKWIQAVDFNWDSYWNSHEATFHHLKNISINGYVTEPFALQMV